MKVTIIMFSIYCYNNENAKLLQKAKCGAWNKQCMDIFLHWFFMREKLPAMHNFLLVVDYTLI